MIHLIGLSKYLFLLCLSVDTVNLDGIFTCETLCHHSIFAHPIRECIPITHFRRYLRSKMRLSSLTEENFLCFDWVNVRKFFH